MPSKEYGALYKNVAALKKQFLNFAKRVDGAYSGYELTQCRAFITFCHAEVEIYLEAVSAKIVDRAEKQWSQRRRVTNAIAAMIAYRSAKEVKLPDNPIEQGDKTKFETLIGKAIASQRAVIRGNHGIKPNNLAELFIPIGMGSNQFEEALVIQLKNLGERRGDQVHQNSQISLPKIRDPFDDELHDIDFLLSELKPFDELTNQLK